ncbi:MAG: sulfotransferase family protein [Nitrospirota bacterium]|nr:sulfotransferase family protein [Nitrospirota bacterium]
MKRLFQLFGKKKHQDVTIVSGLPRSGTSMMMKMLEAGGLPPLTDKLRTADDDNPKGYYEFERVKKLDEGDIAWLSEAQGKAVKVISALLTYLPPTYTYRVIFMQRAMPEILASQKKMLIHRHEDADDVSDEEMAALYTEHLRHVDSWIDGRPNIRRININFNEIIKNPGAHLETINKFLDGCLDTGKAEAVIDPSLYRQKER